MGFYFADYFRKVRVLQYTQVFFHGYILKETLNKNSMNNSIKREEEPGWSRKKFIVNAAKTTGAMALLTVPGAAWAGSTGFPQNQYTVQEIIDMILKEVPDAPFRQTVDTIKSGRADQPVTGIVTTMFTTIEVIQQAIKLKANFIIAHEPTYYNHLDDVNWVKDNRIQQQKQELLQKNNITVWRFHDYCHALKPDAISYGVVKKLDWLSEYKTGERMITIPGVTLKELVTHVKSSLGITHVKVIGDLKQHCERIALLPGAWGGQLQVKTAENEKPDVLIVGELQEWETAEYIRDARALGSSISLIILGHSVSEEPGMAWVAEWLQPKVPELSIHHLASGDPFMWI